MALTTEDRALLESFLRDAKKEAKNNFDITQRRLVELTSKDYYYYAIGFLFSSFINTFYDLHKRDMTEGEQDEVIEIMKEKIKRGVLEQPQDRKAKETPPMNDTERFLALWHKISIEVEKRIKEKRIKENSRSSQGHQGKSQGGDK